jgi:VWFA-related protein
LAVVLFPALLRAQLVESIEVRVTSVDVVVTDRDGKPVSGLTKDDFELYENGKPQTITNFYAIERSTAPAAEGARLQTEAIPEERRKRRIVFFVDNESLGVAQRNRFLNVLDREIARLVHRGDEATVIVWNHRAVTLQPFTSDVAALQRSLHEQMKNAGNSTYSASKSMMRSRIFSLIEAARANPIFGMRFFIEAHDVVTTWTEEVYMSKRRVLQGLSATVARMAGVEGKKVMVFATGGLPEHTGLETYEWVEGLFRPVVPNIPTGRARLDASNRSLTHDLERLARQANTDGVTMYLIDASGTIKSDASTLDMPNSTLEFLERSNTAGSLQLIATITGGIALTGSDNFKFALDTIARDLDVYYSLGYRPPDSDDRENRVMVKVKRPGLVVRSRRSWAPKSLGEQMEDRVIANVFHSGITSDFPIELTLRGEPQKKDRGLISLPLRVTIPASLTLLPDGTDVAGGFSVYLVVGGTNGELSKVAKTDHSVRVPAVEEQSVRSQPFTYDVDLTVRAGASTLSIAVVDRISHQTAFTRKIVDAH